MKLLVVGASQGTGAWAVKAALARGHQVSAFSRTPSKLAVEHGNLVRLSGSFHDAAQVSSAVSGHEAIIVTASATSLAGFKEKPDYFSHGTRLVIDAMKQHHVKRLVVLSALGVGESRSLANVALRFLVIDGLLKRPFADHVVQERLTRESGLEWVIAQPGRLTDGPALGTYVTKTELAPVPSSISRADVADFLVRACETGEFVGKTVLLGG
jgi:putative NADH-flavin reductase